MELSTRETRTEHRWQKSERKECTIEKGEEGAIGVSATVRQDRL